jgi:catechol 2,3-dioxygenase-like lactoylglutathione lyase family enzyme
VTSRLTEVIIDCHDLDAMAEFWCSVLGYRRDGSGDGWLAIGPENRATTTETLRGGPQPPVVAFVLVPEEKMTKNRAHIDVTPFDTTQAEEVARLEGLGARRIDIAQGETPWVVMADPEGNEFCVMPELDAPESSAHNV